MLLQRDTKRRRPVRVVAAERRQRLPRRVPYGGRRDERRRDVGSNRVGQALQGGFDGPGLIPFDDDDVLGEF
jgi:hypothetical protein